MKKLICIALALMLILSLCGCGAHSAQPSASSGAVSSNGSEVQEPAGTQPDAPDVSSPEKPEEAEDPDEPEVPDEPEKPDEPEVMTGQNSVYNDAVAVTFCGLADNHSAEVQLGSGEYLTLQFDSSVYGDLMNSLVEGDEIVVLLEGAALDGGGQSWKLSEYLGAAYQGVILTDGKGVNTYDWEIVCRETELQSFVLFVKEELTGIEIYTLEFQDDGSLKKGDLWTSKDTLYQGNTIGFQLHVEEYYPNWLLEYTLSDGSRVQYLIGMAEEPLYMPVTLMPAGSRLTE